MTAKDRMRALLDDQPDDSSFSELLRALAKENVEGVDADQIAERLRWSPLERLRYLLDMLDFEERAHCARRVPTPSSL